MENINALADAEERDLYTVIDPEHAAGEQGGQDTQVSRYAAGGARGACEGCRARSHEASRSLSRRGAPLPDKHQGMSYGFDFDCNICLNYVEVPVVTQCGHLFCWACLYQWAHKASICAICPICKCDLDISTVVTIFSKGGSSRVGADASVPSPPPVKRKYTKKTMDIFTTGVFSLPDGRLVRGGNLFQLGPHSSRRPRNYLFRNFLISRVLCVVIAVGLVVFFIVE